MQLQKTQSYSEKVSVQVIIGFTIKKCLAYIAFTFALFPAFDSLSFLEAAFDCHPCIRDAYFSTLLQADKQWLCDICEIGVVNSGLIRSAPTDTILSGRYPVISTFGAKLVIPYLTSPWVVLDANTKSGTTVFSTFETIRGLPNPLVTALLVPWESDMTDFSARSRLVGWQERQQKARVDAADDMVWGINQLHEHAAYKDAVAGFYYTLHLPPEKPAAYYYRATAKLALGDTESTLGNVEQAQYLYQTAIQDYTQAISGTPGNINAYVFRSYAKFRLGILASAVGNAEQAQHHYHAAISDCSQAMAVYQRDEAALKAALAVHTEVSDVMRDYPSAIRFRDRYAFAYYLRGLEKQALGQHTAAAADFRKAKVLQLMPESGGPLAPTLGRRLGWDW